LEEIILNFSSSLGVYNYILNVPAAVIEPLFEEETEAVMKKYD